MMKRLIQKSHYISLLIVSLAALWAVVAILPTQLPAQDIDDVIDGLDKDFSMGGKQEVKQDNLAAANEQNREDIQIERNEAANQNLTITYSAMTTSNIRTNHISVLGQIIQINEEDTVTGMGTETATFPFPVNIQAGLTFPLNVSVTCLAGNCEVSASLSGTVNGISVSCTTISTGFFMAPSTVIAGPSTCTTN